MTSKRHSELTDRQLVIRNAVQAVQDTNFSKGHKAVELLRGVATSLLSEVASLEEQLEAQKEWGERQAEFNTEMATRLDELEEQLEALQKAVDRWDARPPDCECREIHFLNFCERCLAEEKLRSLVSNPASEPQLPLMDDYPDAVPGGPVTHPASSPLADHPPAPEDVERAGELARERGWKDRGGKGVVSDPASKPPSVESLLDADDIAILREERHS